MVKVGKWIAKHRILMLIIGFLLIIPSVIGMAATKVNYDLLSYLPEHLETVKGQDILVDEYGMGAFSMVVVENMEMKDVQKLEEKFEQVNHVKEVLWYDDPGKTPESILQWGCNHDARSVRQYDFF